MPKHFEYVGLEPFQGSLARVLANSIRARILQAQDVHDQPAPALTRGYARAKRRRGRVPIRDWYFTGQTIAAIAPLRGEYGELKVGFNDPVAARRAAINNARTQQFGVSPRNREDVAEAINGIRGQLVRVA